MAEYRLSPKAQRDLDGMFDYTVGEWRFAQALRYTDLIEAACAALAKTPMQAQDCGHIRPGLSAAWGGAAPHLFSDDGLLDCGGSDFAFANGCMSALLN